MADDRSQQKVQETRAAEALAAEQETNRRLTAELAELRSKEVPVVAEPRVYRDPYDSQNPLTFKKHPQGFQLGWKNPVYRERHRGWRGWVPVTYDNAIGKKLGEYLIDPPHKLKNDADNIVRRGDSILCALPSEIWEARQLKRTQKAAHQRAENQGDTERETEATRRMVEQRDPTEPNSYPGATMTS